MLFACSVMLSEAQAQRFGGAVAATDDYAFVGETGNGSFLGEVYVYAKADDWENPAKISAGEVGDRFGSALAADGSTLLVGSAAANENRGEVYVYTNDGAWTLTGKLVAEDGAEGDRFGLAVAVHGDVALISAPGRAERTGAVYVFSRGDGGQFSQTQMLVPDGLEAGASFGSAVAVGEETVAALASGRSAAAVYTYAKQDNKWNMTDRLAPEDFPERSFLGGGLAISEGRIYVGATSYEQGQGAVLEYSMDGAGGSMVETARLRPFDPGRRTQFGSSIAIDGDKVWIGAPGADQGTGAIYGFTRDGNAFSGAKRTSIEYEEGRASYGSTLALSGDVAVIGATGIDYGAGAAVILERNADGFVWQAIVINDVRGYDPVTGGELRCTDGVAADWECSEIDLVSFLPTKDIGGKRGVRLNDIWGWTDPETGREYALVGRSDGTSFVDVTSAEMPVYVGDLPMTPGSRPNVWRDIKVYRDHAYVVADGAGEHGVQVFDLQQLRDVTAPPVTFEATSHYPGIHSAHNIVINEDTGFGFVVGASGGGETCGGGLHMLDLSNPMELTFAGCFADPTTGRRKTGYSHDAQCVVYHGPDADYHGREVCFGSNETAISIADVTDKDNPVPLAMAAYPQVAYTHQGWLTEDHRYFYMNDEGDEPQGLVEGTRTLVWDVSDLDDPVLVKEYIAQTTTTDHNLYVKGNLMYQSNYGSGLRVIDISNPEDPVEVGFFDTISGSWSNYPYFKSGNIVVTGGNEGLFVVKQREVDT